MKCPKCNEEIDDRSAFCSFCGSKIENIDFKDMEDDLIDDTNESSMGNNEIIENDSLVDDEGLDDNKDKEQVIDNKSDNPKKRRHSIITILILVFLIVVAIITSVLIIFCKNPERVYKTIITATSSTVFNNNISKHDSASTNLYFSFNTDIEQLKDLDGLKMEGNVQYNLNVNDYVAKIKIDKNETSYLDLNAILNLVDNKVYIKDEKIYNKVLSVDIPEEFAQELNEKINQNNGNIVDEKTTKIISNKISNAFNSNLSKEHFSSRNVTIKINGEDKKVKDNILSLSSEQLKDILINSLNELRRDNEFLSCFESKNEIIDIIDNGLNIAESLKNEKFILECHYYTSGIFNSFCGCSIAIIDDLENKTVIDFSLQDKNTSEITIKALQGNKEYTIMDALLKLNKNKKNEKDIIIEFNMTNVGKITIRFASKIEYNKEIEKFDTSDNINVYDIGEEEKEEIYTNIIQTPIYPVIESISETSKMDSNVGADNNVISTPSNIKLQNGQSYVQTLDDDIIKFYVPSTFEEEYGGNSYKSYSKDTKVATAYVNVSTRYSTLDEYEERINTSLDYYRTQEGYKDLNISGVEEITIADTKFYKKIANYTYSSGSYATTYTTSYYYKEMNNGFLYTVEVEDYNRIVTDLELEKFLSIEE